jgi:hypothetical protein
LQAAWRPKSAKWSRTGSARITPTRLRKRRLPPGRLGDEMGSAIGR